METTRLRPLASRPVSAGGGVTSRHDLSFGAHYDPERTSFGALIAHNDDVLDPGVAYGPHEHRDVEIVTWVLAGAMRHRGPDGREDVVRPGTVQRLSAGTGWRHDECNDSPTGPLRLLQMWLVPDGAVGEPVLEHADAGAALAAGEPVVLAGPGGRVGCGRSDATLTAVRLAPGGPHRTTPARWVHAVVARGSVRQGEEGGAEVTEGGADVVAGVGDVLESRGTAVHVVAGDEGAELLVWEMAAGPF